MYFNNLKGFDGHFIIPILDNAGYENVLDFDISEIKELDPITQNQYLKRYLRIQDNLFTNKKIAAKYHEIMITPLKSNQTPKQKADK